MSQWQFILYAMLSLFLPVLIVITAGYALFQTANNTAVMTDIAPDQRGEEQAIRLERAAHLRQSAGQIVDELQRQERHDEIERAIGERQRFLVGQHLQSAVV